MASVPLCIPCFFSARNLGRVLEPTVFVDLLVGQSVPGQVLLPLLCRNSCRNSCRNFTAHWTLANKYCAMHRSADPKDTVAVRAAGPYICKASSKLST